MDREEIGRRDQVAIDAGTGIRRRPGLVLFVAAVLIPAFLFVLAAWSSYRDTLRISQGRVERTARVLEEHVNKVFETHRLVVQQVKDRLRYVDWAKETDRADLHDMLADLQNTLDQVTTITITDAEGRMAASGRTYPADPKVSFADRDWFTALRDGRRGAYISKSYLGRQSHQPVFNLAVPLRDGAGRFAGAIAVSIDRSYFEKFYTDVEPEFDHAVTLVRADGEILARMPRTTLTRLPDKSRFLDEIALRPFGSYIGPSNIDAVTRVFAYRKVGDYPVFVRFGISVDAILAPWRRSLVAYGIVALLSALALAIASWVAMRQTGRERVARLRWQQAAAALEAETIERERVDAQLRQMQKMEAIGRLTGGIAHDFNNFLSAVIGNLDLALRRIEDDKASRLVGNAADGAKRAAALVERLLAFSRQQPVESRRADVASLVVGMRDLLQMTLGSSVDLSIDAAGDLWPVEVDASQLENAVLNLAANARDAMPGGGRFSIAAVNRTLETGTAGEVDAGDYVVVVAADSGEGMTPDVLAKVFEPFFTTKPVGKGTGLGLSQVYGFANQSGGSVTVRSAVGRGTTFSLFLPRAASRGLAGERGTEDAGAAGADVPADGGRPGGRGASRVRIG